MIIYLSVSAQGGEDTSLSVGKKVITLSEVVVAKGLDVPHFIERVKDDSSFYKAFRNLRILGFTSINDVRILDKKAGLVASLNSRTRQEVSAGCRTMKILEEKTTGDFYAPDGSFNYYTADMYASLFFTRGKVCGENNIVAGREFSLRNKKGMEKHREQLKILFFEPGKKVSGIPMVSGKTELFADDLARFYDISIDAGYLNGNYCYMLIQKAKPGKESRLVIDEMTTWFNDSTFEVMGRNYILRYDAGVFDFDVRMEVEMTRVGSLTVPNLIRYRGNWKAPFKKRERSLFTATLSAFGEK
jgi:hypothetical protein